MLVANRGDSVWIAGTIVGLRIRLTRRDRQEIAFIDLRRENGEVLEGIVFPKAYESLREILVLQDRVRCAGLLASGAARDEDAPQVLLVEAAEPV